MGRKLGRCRVKLALRDFLPPVPPAAVLQVLEPGREKFRLSCSRLWEVECEVEASWRLHCEVRSVECVLVSCNCCQWPLQLYGRCCTGAGRSSAVDAKFLQSCRHNIHRLHVATSWVPPALTCLRYPCTQPISTHCKNIGLSSLHSCRHNIYSCVWPPVGCPQPGTTHAANH
jgi:hypothetical protein